MTGKYPERPAVITDDTKRFDSFENGEYLPGKKNGRLPAMGWNSWNAFGSGNTEALTIAMADKIKELKLDELGYEYIVLDDGCYKSERVDGKLSNEEVKFPHGFKYLADYMHEKGLKFGMYNDIGTNLCAGAEVGTCGHEAVDAASYLEWDVDFLKVDNCYYLWDNATFSNSDNARYVFAPAIKGIKIGPDTEKILSATKDGKITGNGIEVRDDYVRSIGTFDGTGPMHSPVYVRSGELRFDVYILTPGEYRLYVEYASGRREGCGNWLQVAVENSEGVSYPYDDLLKETPSKNDFEWSDAITLTFAEGINTIRLMNHRRQENTLISYATLMEELDKQDPSNDIILSICEWGKTQPQNWGKKVGNSWRILNDITFSVGSDGDPGNAAWESNYTTGVTAQYNKAVVMDEFAGLSKGWNDPDMMMIGMNGLTPVMNKTHMVMWCMMNSPLMLGLDLRRVNVGDEIYELIANKDLIALNQDALGIQAKRIYSSIEKDTPDKEYITWNDRVDILAKPLSDNSVALSFINVSTSDKTDGYSVDVENIVKFIGEKMVDKEAFLNAKSYLVKDLITGETCETSSRSFAAEKLEACDSKTIKVSINA